MTYEDSVEPYSRIWAPALARARAPLTDRLPWDSCRRLIDIGAGTGTLLEEALRRGVEVCVGIDTSPAMLARAPGGASRLIMDAHALGFRDGTFDLAALFFVLGHASLREALGEARRVLRPGGILAAATWHRRGGVALEGWIAALDDAGGEKFPDPGKETGDPVEVETVLHAVGFCDVEITIHRFTWDPSPDEFIALRSHLGMSARRLKSLPQPARADLLKNFTARLHDLTESERQERCEVLLIRAC